MIGRISTRSDFGRLRETGERKRSGPISVLVDLSADEQGPRVAYAIGRDVGSAVRRNLLRRRLRAILTELDASDDVPPGLYLLRCQSTSAHLSYQELRRHVRRLFVREPA